MNDRETSEVELARSVLDAARELALELHPHRRRSLRVALDSSLDRDLGLDSLGRVELLMRLERTLRVRLPEALLAGAATPRDLISGVLAARSAGAAPPELEVRDLVLGPVASAPDEALTLVDVLEWHCREHPERTHVVLDQEGTDVELSYRGLRERSAELAGGLRARGVEPGQSVAIMLPTSHDFFVAFFGALWAGAVPVPIYPPFRPAQLEDHLRRQAGILANADARLLVVPDETHAVAALLRAQVSGLHVDTVRGLAARARGADSKPHPARSDEIALLQYTSGSTGRPKGVVLSHANLLANIRAMGSALGVTSSDVFVSWLPLYHDMGLIGAWLGSLYHSVPAAISPPLRFLSRPESWLWAIHRRRGTISAAPNFAYELCVRRIDDEALDGLDLSSWRLALNGSEPVSPETLRRFAERFARHGFRREALLPVYGLAESAVGLAFPPPGRGPVIDRISRTALVRSGAARPAEVGEAGIVELPSCGSPLPGHEIRVVDTAGRELGERREGRLQFRGPSATRGYFRNESLTRALFAGDWLESGDLAYLAAGEVHITGRTKDMIIRAGRNIYPHELEDAVGDLPGVRKGCVAVFGSADPETRTERVIVLAETRETDADARDSLRRRIDDVTALLLETAADDVVLAPPHTVLKTSSGKIRRSACRELYEQGRLLTHPRALPVQVARLALTGALERARFARRRAGALAYSAAWWTLLASLGAMAWLLVIALPRLSWRWTVVNLVSRAFLRLTATPFRVEGAQNVPERGGAVLVANHASYLDGLVLAAALRRPARFVAKRELAGQRVAGPFLRRLGALFVERFELDRGVTDAQRTVDAARAGDLVIFFAEGTLYREPGLRPFHLGAFTAAAAAAAPVVPAAIRGTRSILRGDQWFARRGSVELRIAAPLWPKGSDWASAVELRADAYDWILAGCGEPGSAATAALSE
jgi:1-acyl-sn-glycerol-3-phosphate acyltransferase